MPRRSFVHQTLHYFARPHDGVRREPIVGPSAWTAESIAGEPWRERLTDDEIAALREATAAAAARGVPTERLTRDDFPLPGWQPRLDAWRHELDAGRGFVVLSGFPVESWTEAEAGVAFWCLGLHLGVPGAQNQAGDLLGHVKDVGAAYGPARGYLTSAALSYHCDAADVVGLLCLATAREGGRSRIVSSTSVYNRLLERAPDMVERLYAPVALDTHDEAGTDWTPIRPCRAFEGRVRTFWHADYFRSAARHPTAPPPPDALIDLYQEIANDPELYLEMDLGVGDVQLLSNHAILHARTGYVDDPAHPWHLLRLWISFPAPPGERWARRRAGLELAGALARRRVGYRLGGRAR